MVKIITSSSDFSNLGLNSSQKSLIVTKDAPSAIQIKNYFDEHLSRICNENNCTYNLKLTFIGTEYVLLLILHSSSLNSGLSSLKLVYSSLQLLE